MHCYRQLGTIFFKNSISESQTTSLYIRTNVKTYTIGLVHHCRGQLLDKMPNVLYLVIWNLCPGLHFALATEKGACTLYISFGRPCWRSYTYIQDGWITNLKTSINKEDVITASINPAKRLKNLQRWAECIEVSVVMLLPLVDHSFPIIQAVGYYLEINYVPTFIILSLPADIIQCSCSGCHAQQ